MKLEITTPDDYMGEIVGDLQQRRAIIEKTENRGITTMILALSPLKELFGYSSAIRSLSQAEQVARWNRAAIKKHPNTMSMHLGSREAFSSFRSAEQIKPKNASPGRAKFLLSRASVESNSCLETGMFPSFTSAEFIAASCS